MDEIKKNIETCGQLLSEQGLTIAFAESATAGKLAYTFSQTEYSGQILKGGLICYDACLKEDILGIPRKMIEEFTPESPEITREMAVRLKKVIPADVIVAVTGLTTPGGSEVPGKPVGTMFYCILINDEVHERKKIFTGEPEEIIDYTIEQIAKTIIKILEGGD
jgi:nicotinamide-nucleotide amidase